MKDMTKDLGGLAPYKGAVMASGKAGNLKIEKS